MAKKEIIYQGLIDLNVAVEDNSISSPDYFRVTNIPSEFFSGRNILKFKGNPNIFNEGAPVYIEILDYNGEPIYYEVGLDTESESQAAVITVFINQDTTPGNGLITICGTASRDIEGNFLNTELLNVRWSTPVYIDPSKENNAEIVFESLPTATISASTGSYTNLGYSNGTRIISQSVSGLEYYYYNNTPVLTTSSLAGAGFSGSALAAAVSIPYTSISEADPLPQGTVSASLIFTSSISSFSGDGIAFLSNPVIFPLVNSNSDYAPTYAALTALITYEQSASLASTPTQNTFNVATVFFTGLQPQIGVVKKIRSYVKSSGVGEYELSNETDISAQADELGFTANVVTASFALPTVHRNDRLDFKFEFVNPVGLVSGQYVELLNNLFLGGNTYIGGNDNLLTGSLFVAGATGTGVEITGKAQSAMVRSLGYQGFQNAITNNGGAFSGFVIYSGSVQSILGAAESYSGVGLELVANSSSYFKYASANGGLIDIKTNSFFLGSNTTFISGSDGNILISGSNIKINTPSFLLGVKGVPSSSYVSGSDGKLEMYSNRFILTTSGTVTASGVFVPKAFFSVGGGSTFQGGNIGYGDGIRPMIEPDNVWVDATNIGRCVHPSDPTEYSYALSTANTSGAVFKTVTLHTMANERLFTTACHYKVSITGTPGDYMNSGGVFATIYYTQSGSSGVGGLQSGTYDAGWILSGSATGTAIIPDQGFLKYVGDTVERVITGRRLVQLPIPNEIVKSGGQMQIRYTFRTGPLSGPPTATFFAKYIEVMTGRDLGLNFKDFVIGSPEYSSIGAGPVPPVAFIPID
jgi:hypothetical protein